MCRNRRSEVKGSRCGGCDYGAEPSCIAPFSGPRLLQFDKLVAALREGAERVHKGRTWSLPFQDQVLLGAACTEKVLMDERMGHIDGSVSARYAHVTLGMRRRLMAGLTEQWEASLDARRRLHTYSSVAALDRLLRARDFVTVS